MVFHLRRGQIRANPRSTAVEEPQEVMAPGPYRIMDEASCPAFLTPANYSLNCNFTCPERLLTLA